MIRGCPTISTTKRLLNGLRQQFASRSRWSDARAIREARIAKATAKIRNVLRYQIVCHQKELERRVCEVGFRFYPLAEGKDRPEPVHMYEARKRLTAQGRLDFMQATIAGNKHFFYYDPEQAAPLVRETLDQRIRAVEAFEAIQRTPALSGWALERLMHAAMTRSGQVDPMPYRSGVDIIAFNGATSTHGIDLAGVHTVAKTPFVAEVKNIREWVYPHSPIVWKLLGTAAELRSVPILIARRIAEPTYLFMDEVGGYAYPTMNQFVDQALDDDPRAAAFRAAAALLGYKDVKLVDPEEPEERFVEFFRTRLGDRLPAMAEKYAAHRDSALAIARDENLWSEISRGRQSGRPRREIVRDYWGALRSNEADDDFDEVMDDF